MLLWEPMEAPVPSSSHQPITPAPLNLDSLLEADSAPLFPSFPPWLSAHFAGSSGIPFHSIFLSHPLKVWLKPRH